MLFFEFLARLKAEGAELDAAPAGARDPVEREQHAERQLQLALQHRAQQFTRLLGKGPNGEEPEIAANIQLTEEELARIQEMNARAAIVLHYGANDWSQGQVEGLRHQFAAMGIEVIAITDAGFDPRRQAADIEKVLEQRPDVIVSVPVDPVVTASAYRAAAASGVKLVFMENTPRGFAAGADYVGVVSADNYGNGAASADLMAEALGGEGEIGVIAHDADFFVTRERREAFEETLKRRFPKIRILIEEGITGPDFAREAARATETMLRAHPSLKGIWAVWDVPAEGVIAAARAAGRNDLVVTTIDLGRNVALEMARGGLIKGVAAQRVFDQGVTEGILAGYGLLGKPAPAYVALPALPVTAANLADAWQIVYRRPNPDLE
ncbi:MAG: substrate-binding domain-containing protein [Acetobacteraceae bacterium]|nr:substrate-binding domain-containing protein [Acetobacteraceae bacterium]